MTNIWNYCGWDLEVVGRSFFFFFFSFFSQSIEASLVVD